MSLTYGFYNSQSGDRVYSTSQISDFLDGLVNDGIFAPITDGEHVGFQVVAQSPNIMGVNVSVGKAWFNATWTKIDSAYPVALDSANALLNRIDAIVLTIDKTREGRTNYIEVIKGTEVSGTPEKPEIQNGSNIYRYPLAYVTINAAVSSITDSMIENNINVDGGIPLVDLTSPLGGNYPTTEALLSQYKAEFDDWFNYMKNQLTTDAAGNLQKQIDQTKITNCNGVLQSAVGNASVSLGNTTVSTNYIYKISTETADDAFNLANGSMIAVIFNTGAAKSGSSDTVYFKFYNYSDDTAYDMDNIPVAYMPPINDGGRMIFIYEKATDEDTGEFRPYIPALSDTYSTLVGSASEGVAASQKALYDCRVDMQNSFQAGVDAVYNAVKAEGVTPSASTPTAIAAAIATIRNGGNATAGQILSGRTAIVNKATVTGTMANRGAWTGSGTPSGNNNTNVTIPAGYHNGSGYVTCVGGTSYNNGYNAGYSTGRNNAKSAICANIYKNWGEAETKGDDLLDYLTQKVGSTFTNAMVNNCESKIDYMITQFTETYNYANSWNG